MKTIPKNLPWKEACKKKWIAPDALNAAISKIKEEGKTIATLNGSFDLLQAGHLYIIFEAAKQADILLVALNTDRSIQQYKSPSRPIIPLEYRLQLISALECVDYVTWFDETDPRKLLEKVQPDVHVNGQEYGTECIEAEVIKSYGGKLYLVDRIDNLATSEIIKKIKSLCD